MSPLFAKLNLKDHGAILLLQAPASFEAEIAGLGAVRVLRDLCNAGRIAFVLAFVTRRAEIEPLAPAICERAIDDPIIWFAYPKGSSKNYRCDFNRDTGWAALGAAGFEAVRQVAIDADWSALRFRRVQFIKSLTRDPARARSALGRARTMKRADGPGGGQA